MSIVKNQMSNFLKWVETTSSADSIGRLIERFDELYETYAKENNVAGAIVDSLIQMNVEKKPKKPRAPKKSQQSPPSPPQSESVDSNPNSDDIVQTIINQSNSVMATEKKKRVYNKKPKPTGEPPVTVAEEQPPVTVAEEQPPVTVAEEQPPVTVAEEQPPVTEKKKRVYNKRPKPEEPSSSSSSSDVVAEEQPVAEKKKRAYNKKPKMVDNETNVMVVVPELVEEPIIETPMAEESEETESKELESCQIDGVEYYIDNEQNVYNMEFKHVGKIENDQLVLL